MQQPSTFDSIWYREKPARESTRADPFVRERGRLVVMQDGLRFESPRANVVLRDIEAMEYGVFGTMTGPSIQVRYRDGGEARHAWFTDGRLGGYAGMFGGTRQLVQALSHLAPIAFDDDAARASQRRMLLLLGGMALVFIRLAFF